MSEKKSTKKAPKKSAVKKAVSEVKKTVKKAAKKVVKAVTPDVKTTNGVSVTHTVAKTPKEIMDKLHKTPSPFLPHAVHAEAIQAIENENNEVAVEPKHDGSAVAVARLAWHEVKDAGDPEFDQCVSTHRDKLMDHADGILKGGSPMIGETMLARFEQAVSRLK